MDAAIDVVRQAFRQMSEGRLEAPPRFHVASGDGSLVFTAGSSDGVDPVVGFRCYGVFPTSGVSPDPSQLVGVFDGRTGALRGIIVGSLLGAVRTAAIDGVAVDVLARQNSSSLALIGAGFQARHHAEAALAVRRFTSIRIHSRTEDRARELASDLRRSGGASVDVCSTAREAVDGSDVVLCLTNSRIPVIESAWIRPGMHVSTIGPKTIDGHELPSDIASVCDVIATDSPAQVASYPRPFFLADTSRMIGLDSIVSGHHPGRSSNDEATMFCSVGLAGTEVMLGAELIARVCATDA